MPRREAPRPRAEAGAVGTVPAAVRGVRGPFAERRAVRSDPAAEGPARAEPEARLQRAPPGRRSLAAEANTGHAGTAARCGRDVCRGCAQEETLSRSPGF